MFTKKNSANEKTPENNKKTEQEPLSESLNFGLWSNNKSKEKNSHLENLQEENSILENLEKETKIE